MASIAEAEKFVVGTSGRSGVASCPPGSDACSSGFLLRSMRKLVIRKGHRRLGIVSSCGAHKICEAHRETSWIIICILLGDLNTCIYTYIYIYVLCTYIYIYVFIDIHTG